MVSETFLLPGAVRSVLGHMQRADVDGEYVAPGEMKILHEDSAIALLGVVFSRDPMTVAEIGCGFGFSTLWIASALNVGAKMLAVDTDPFRVEIAKSFISTAGFSDRIRFKSAAVCREDYEASFPDGVDLLFIDCWKDAYLDELHKALPSMREGSLVVADNVLSHADKLQDFLGFFEEHQRTRRFSTRVLECGEGLLIARIR